MRQCLTWITTLNVSNLQIGKLLAVDIYQQLVFAEEMVDYGAQPSANLPHSHESNRTETVTGSSNTCFSATPNQRPRIQSEDNLSSRLWMTRSKSAIDCDVSKRWLSRIMTGNPTYVSLVDSGTGQVLLP